jgi:hypothetical protein
MGRPAFSGEDEHPGTTTSLMLEAGLLVEVAEQSPQLKKGDDK